MNAPRRTTRFSPVVIPAAAVGLCAAFFAWYPISDGDIFWHLAAGRNIVANGAAPGVDPFAFTSDNYRWIDLHWLYQLAMFAVYSLAGTTGLLVANSLLFGAAALIAFSAVAARPTLWLSASVWIVALYEIRYLVPHRPIVVSLLCIAVFILCLERFRRSGRTRWLAALIPVQIVWVNCQGLFLLGPAVFAAFFSGEAITRGFEPKPGGGLRLAPRFALGRAAAVAGIGCAIVAASALNPYGIEAFSLAVRLFGRIDPSLTNLYTVNIPENTPLAWMLGTTLARYAYGVAALSWIALALAALRPRAVRLCYLFVSLAMLVLAFRAQRNIVLYYFAVLPLIGSLLPGVWTWLEEKLGTKTKPFGAAVTGMSVALSIFTICNHTGVLYDTRGTKAVAPFSFPAGGVEYLRAHPVQGAIFNADRYGGYLLWNLYPPRRVFIDTRYAIRPPSFFAEYLAILDTPARIEEQRKKYDIGAALLPSALEGGRYFTLLRELYENPRWRLVYADGAEALFVFDSTATAAALSLDSAPVVDSLTAHLEKRWRDNPALRKEALSHLGWFLLRMGFPGSAERVPGDSLSAETAVLRAECRHMSGGSAEAIDILGTFLAKKPRCIAVRLALARIYLDTGKKRQSHDAASAVLKLDPWNREARAIVGQTRSQ